MRVFDRFEVQFVAITRADGGVSIMQIDTKAWNEKARLAAEAEIAEHQAILEAVAKGAVAVRDGRPVDAAEITAETMAKILEARVRAVPFVREATDEYIEALIARTELPAPAKSWRRIQPGDLPATRENRDAWRDDGARVAVDPTRVKPPVIDPRDVKIANLEARLAKLESASPTKSR